MPSPSSWLRAASREHAIVATEPPAERRRECRAISQFRLNDEQDRRSPSGSGSYQSHLLHVRYRQGAY